jgi:hypothetical protein
VKHAWLFVIACSSPSAPPQQPAVVATVPADASVDAPPDAPVVDAELLAAPAWVFRIYRTGMIVPQSHHETWTLRWVGDRATILVERKLAEREGALVPAGTTVYTGSTNEGTKFALAAGSQKIALECKREKLDVAAATAVRKPHPRTGKYKEPCSGDPGRWVPPKTTKLDVLSCKLDGFDVPMPFAAAPGVEYVHVNDDCDQQGGGYRIATDGAVAPVR